MRRLFEPNARAIGRPPGPTKCDAVPDSLIDGTPSALRDELVRLVGRKQVFHRIIDLVRWWSPRPATQRPRSTPGQRTRIFQRTEPVKWGFCTQQDGLTNRSSSWSRNQLARSDHRNRTRLDDQDMEATIAVMRSGVRHEHADLG
jgi:hypothetical protein